MKRGTKKTESDSGPKMMDPSIPEASVAAPQANTGRPCWAIETLREEVQALFPETAIEYSAYNGRNTALGVTFDCAMLDDEDWTIARKAVGLIPVDARVQEIVVDGDQRIIYAAMYSNARTQDSREPFGLADAYALLIEGDDEEPTGADGGTAERTSADTMDGGGA
jgi:hypothetical protein